MNKWSYYYKKLTEYPLVKAGYSIFCASMVFLFGEFNEAIKVLIVFIIADIITGMTKSIKMNIEINGDTWITAIWKGFKIVRSKVLREGIAKIIEYGIAIMIANLLSIQYGMEPIRNFVIFWISFTELKSVIENLEDININLPECIEIVLRKIKSIIKEVLYE